MALTETAMIGLQVTAWSLVLLAGLGGVYWAWLEDWDERARQRRYRAAERRLLWDRLNEIEWTRNKGRY